MSATPGNLVDERPEGRAGTNLAARLTARASSLAVVTVGTLTLAGCAVATTTQLAEGASGHPGGAAARPEAISTPSALSADVMYRLLVAEFAGRRGNLPTALANYLDVARDTRDAGAAERAVRIAVFSRDEQRGLESARLSTEITPDSVEARQVLASMLLRTGDADGAALELIALAETLSNDPAHNGYARIAEMLAREKDQDTAIAVMERVVGERPDDAGALFAFGTLLARFGELDRAYQQFERVLAVEPDHEEALVVQARILHRQRDTIGALELLSAALERRPDAPAVRLAYARALVDAKRFEEAREQFELLAEANPADHDVQYALGLLLVQTNRLDEAAERFRLLVDDQDRREAAWFYLGQIAENQRRADDALDAYRRVDRGEHRLNAQIRVAVLLAEVGDLNRARAHLHGLRAENNRDVVRIYRAEAELLVRRDRLEEAMGVYDTAIEQFTENTELLYARAMLAEKLDRLDVLETDLRDILSREPNNGDALNALGYTLADRTDRLEEALELIERAHELKPDDHYVVDSMGWILYRLGRYQDAARHLRRALELSPDAEVAAHLGEVLWVMGNQEEAREIWDTALKATPDDKKLLDVKKRFGL